MTAPISFQPVSRALHRAVDYALDTRRDDGAWESTADPRIFDTSIVTFALARCRPWGIDGTVTRARRWLAGAPAQGHSPAVAVTEAWLRDLALDAALPGSPPAAAFGDEYPARRLLVQILAVAAGTPGVAPEVLREAVAGATETSAGCDVKQWQRVVLAAGSLIADAERRLPPNPTLVEALVGEQWSDGSFCMMPAITAVGFLALSLADAGPTARQRALTYLSSTQFPDGTWRFVPNEVWDTALMVRSLCGLSLFDSRALEPAIGFLARSQGIDGGWGIRRGIEADNDTTAMALMALAGTRQGKGAWPAAESYINRQRSPQGMWSTWQSRDDRPSQDVTAHLVSALRAHGAAQSGTARAKRWLLAQHDGGGWKADWYTPRSYAVAEIGDAVGWSAPASRAALGQLLTEQLPDGGWLALPGESTSSPVATALAVSALVAAEPLGAPRALGRALEVILSTQNSLGTWPGTPFMYGPRPFLNHFQAHTHAFVTAALRDVLLRREAATPGERG
ncbi:prenyltransferase/squalene oxidase repeat-containing protein [Streptomyces omiyaensis]|uniref:prenyltransferase/squalene oxidase repeat-containing protein n=1 Tax=Streptomyces omiyaensis TaxID=68247 RepID=UPI0036FA0105